MAANSSGETTLRLLLTLSIIINFLFIGNHFLKKYISFDKAAGSSSYYLNRQTVFDLLPVTRDDIVFAGDSHTQFFEANEYLNNPAIKNRGIYNDNTIGLLKRTAQYTAGQPKKIFLEIGFNDIGFFPVDTTCKNIALIVKQIRKQSPNTIIYLNSIFPSSRESYKASVPELNVKIKKLCTDLNITYIDVYSKLVAANGLLNKLYDCGDGIHLSGEGFLIWSKVLKPYL